MMDVSKKLHSLQKALQKKRLLMVVDYCQVNEKNGVLLQQKIQF
jgi:hypothetical protein